MIGDSPSWPTEVKAVYEWYKKAQIDYIQQFISMYVAYNAWYREVTGTTNDRQAISVLKKRFVIWDDYCKGRTMHTLRPYLERLAELTQREPFMSSTVLWSGSLEGAQDWRSLIEFWYQVRCKLVHGSEVNPKYTWLAYETLDAFMGEIVTRMQKCITTADARKIRELNSVADKQAGRIERFEQLQNRLYQKYITSPDIWQVDMCRV